MAVAGLLVVLPILALPPLRGWIWTGLRAHALELALVAGTLAALVGLLRSLLWRH